MKNFLLISAIVLGLSANAFAAPELEKRYYSRSAKYKDVTYSIEAPLDAMEVSCIKVFAGSQSSPLQRWVVGIVAGPQIMNSLELVKANVGSHFRASTEFKTKANCVSQVEAMKAEGKYLTKISETVHIHTNLLPGLDQCQVLGDTSLELEIGPENPWQDPLPFKTLRMSAATNLNPTGFADIHQKFIIDEACNSEKGQRLIEEAYKKLAK